MTLTDRVPPDVHEFGLDRQTCLELVDRCGSATLACTVRALPSALMVAVRAARSSILLAVGSAMEADRLAGQIVALGAGVPATPKAAGWWVLIRGELKADPGSPRTLVLVPSEIQGCALPAEPRRRWGC